MESLQESETKLNFAPHFFKSSSVPIHIKHFSPYVISLKTIDISLAVLSFLLSIVLTGFFPIMKENQAELVVALIFSFVVTAFFNTYNLYNFHFIFSKRLHLLNLLKSLLWGLSVYIMIVFLYRWPSLFEDNSLSIGLFLFLFFCGMLLLKKYSNDQLLDFIKAMGLSLMAIGSAGLLLSKQTPLIVINSEIIFVGFSMTLCLILAARLILVHFIFNKILRRVFRRQILIIGSDKEAEIITNHIINHDAPFWVAGTVGADDTGSYEASTPKGCLGRLKELPDIVEREKIDEIIVTNENIDKIVLISLLDYCTTTGLTAWFPPKLLKIIDMKLYIDNFCGIQMIKLCSQKNTWIFNKVKHALDALVTVPIFILQLPLFLVIAAAIKLNSKGPVFYHASSIGKHGREFKMYKFRSMRVGSDNNVHKNYVSKLIKGEIGNRSDQGETLKIMDDDRVTLVGRILRKYSLDELPQLINVLKGEMSLIGPRPCLPYEYEIYEDWHKKRVYVRPGITGLWQVTGRSEVSFEDMILLDLYYIYNKNLIMDFNILYETFFVVLQKRGAY